MDALFEREGHAVQKAAHLFIVFAESNQNTVQPLLPGFNVTANGTVPAFFAMPSLWQSLGPAKQVLIF